jgi:hypothetical protein
LRAAWPTDHHKIGDRTANLTVGCSLAVTAVRGHTERFFGTLRDA